MSTWMRLRFFRLTTASRVFTRAWMVLSSLHWTNGRPVSALHPLTLTTSATSRATVLSMRRLRRGRGTDRRRLLQPALHHRPVDVPEERLDVLGLVGDLVVAHERVLP